MNAANVLAELQKNALGGDASARTVLEHPITHLLLKELVEMPIPAYIRFDVPDAKSIVLKDGKRRIIHGFASVEMIDKQQELITLKALSNAWTRMQKAGEKYANVNLEHTNITVGKVLLKEVVEDSQGQKYWSHIEEDGIKKGLYIVAELRDDIEIAGKVWEMAQKGALNAYSIGGRALKRKVVQKDDQTFFQIDDLELYEVTICKRGKNVLSGFEVLKSYLSHGIITDEAFLQKSDELKKQDKIIKELTLLPNVLGKTIILRENFITQATGEEFSLVVKMAETDPLRRHLEMGLLKALPPNQWDDLSLEYGNKSEDSKPLFHLALIPSNITLKNVVEANLNQSKKEKSMEDDKSTITSKDDATKKDDAGTGAGTETVETLKARVAKLEEEKKKLEKQVPPPKKKDDDKKPDDDVDKKKADDKAAVDKKDDDGKVDPEVLASLKKLDEAGILPADLKKFLDENTEKKSDVDVRIEALATAVTSMAASIEKMATALTKTDDVKTGDDVSKDDKDAKDGDKDLKKSDDSNLSDADRKDIAEKTALILKAGSPTIKKSDATGDVKPGDAVSTKIDGVPTTLKEMHELPWVELGKIDAKRKVALAGAVV